jgi:hypothetical protein
MDKPAADKQIKIVVPDQQALGTYANFASIVHNFAEFILDFGRMVPGREDAHDVTPLRSGHPGGSPGGLPSDRLGGGP